MKSLICNIKCIILSCEIGAILKRRNINIFIKLWILEFNIYEKETSTFLCMYYDADNNDENWKTINDDHPDDDDETEADEVADVV